MTTMKLTNFEMDGGEYGGPIAITGSNGEVRFHIWLEPHTLKPDSDVLYKNAKGVNVKKLWQSKGIGLKVVPQLLEAAKKLYPQYEEHKRKTREKAKAETEQRRRAAVIRDAAPELFEGLCYITEYLKATWEETPEHAKILAALQETLAKANA